MVVLEQKAESAKQGCEEVMRRMRKNATRRLTTPDLVLLSLLAERAMHGYQANAELERREIRDWAGISRPQVYYSLEKLERARLIRLQATHEPAAGPERSSFETTAKGRAALAEALEREDWTTQRERPAFLTWLALSWQASPPTVRKQLRKREEYLRREIEREQKTLASILAEVGHPYHEAVWMVSLMIEQFRTELHWLKRVEQEMKKRGRAKHPAYAE